MTPLRVLIVDDEAPARSRLRRLLDEVADDQALAINEAADGVEAAETLASEPYDLAFLDVRMPGLDGFSVIEAVPPGRRPDVVFTTAYDEYAIRAFDANATDYLLKPINAERLAVALDRVRERRAADTDTDERLADLLDTLDEVATPTPSDGPVERFTIQGHDRLIVVEAGDVVAAEVGDGITSLWVRADGKLHRHLVGFTLDALEGRLDGAQFMRVHRNALVNLSSIREMIPWFSGRYKLKLEGGHEVTASRARSRELKDRLAL